MTTIAVKGRYMYADTYTSVTGNGSGYASSKIERVGDTLVGCAGPIGLCNRFLAWRKQGVKQPKFALDQPFEALVLTPIGLYVYYTDCEPDRVISGIYAIGTGRQYALGALHAGASLINAVTAACAFDPYSKLPIQKEKL